MEDYVFDFMTKDQELLYGWLLRNLFTKEVLPNNPIRLKDLEFQRDKMYLNVSRRWLKEFILDFYDRLEET